MAVVEVWRSTSSEMLTSDPIRINHVITMRTTLDIEPDVLDLAKSLAEARRISVGKALSWLGGKGASAHTPLAERNGFSVFPVADLGAKFGPEDVRAALDEDDQASGRDFLNPFQPGQ
jgi:hypothetical protein